MAEDKITNVPSPFRKWAEDRIITVFKNIPGILVVMFILGCIAFRILHGPIGDDGIRVWKF